MFWPGMVLNQGQLSIVVSDWESYLGSLFPFVSWGKLYFVRGTTALVSGKVGWLFVFFFLVFVGDILNKRKMYDHHAALWSTSSHDGRDNRPSSGHRQNKMALARGDSKQWCLLCRNRRSPDREKKGNDHNLPVVSSEDDHPPE